MNEYEEDTWNIASWKADIPGKVSYVKHLLSCSQFPDCSRDVILMLEKYLKAYAPDTPPNPGLYLSAFLDDVVDLYIFHSKGSGSKPLSAIQELQLLEVICSCFQDQPSDIVRCGVFYLLFGISSQDIKDGKRHHHLPSLVLKVTSSIVEDYTCLVPASLPFLQSLARHSPQMACQLMIALISLYPVVTSVNQQDERLSTGSSSLPPPALLRVVASWVSDNPELCIMTCPANLLTAGSLRGSVASPESTSLPMGPVLGLLRWVVLMPLDFNVSTSFLHMHKDSRVLCSQLHLAIIQAFLLAGKDKEDPQDEMELEPGEVMDESDNQHVIKGTDLKELSQDMKKLIDKLATVEFNHSIIEQQVQLSMDRFSQTLQVAMATGCLSAAKDELQSVCEHLPSNRLLSTVIQSG
ncbi:uncharacterized protein C7orf26 homolog [Stylophora pistillata]|uniref:uncharacterized protein C7orf26 homolog n=1 Tax=Stylophora pistillata TaxID=50429 RepID=UPI000C04748F|nr:uncharacterized protein C7orf26 homolog [Stylophora pistillata]